MVRIERHSFSEFSGRVSGKEREKANQDVYECV
jgi:hypothetical protein